jgi:cytochrome c553
MRHLRWLSLLVTLSLANAADHPAVVILKTHCVSCHGGDAPVRNLDLTTREGALKGGDRGPAVVPGNVLESLLYRTVTHAHDIKMPQGKPKLPDADIKTIKNWIEDGAPWEAPEESKPAK